MIGRLVSWLAVLLPIAIVAAIALAWPEVRAHGWCEDGMHRLALRAALWWFDRLVPVAFALALAGALLRRARPPSHWAISVLVMVGLARLLCLQPSTAGPNVLLISVDTLRADHLGAYGHTLPTSPVVDGRLAAQGVTFEDVLSQSPKTTPSHMTMLTSLYPCMHGVTMWDDSGAGAVLSPRARTLAEVLQNAGWHTAAFTADGPMHASRGFDRGFDVHRHNQQLPRALRWLDANAGHGRFFVFFHTYEVHDPYAPPLKLLRTFDPDYEGPVLDAVRRIRGGVDGWDQGHKLFWDAVDRTDPRTVTFVQRLYDAGIRNMDQGTLTQLLDALDRLGVANDTLVVFTSDHGEALGEHGAFLHDDLYYDTLHVPFVLRWPAHLPAGRRVPGHARLLDLMPTVLDLVGVPSPPQTQGVSLAPLARGDGGTLPDVIPSEHGPALAPVTTSLRSADHTLLRIDATERLFDLGTDPGERSDVLTAEPAVAATMRDTVATWRAACAAMHARYGPSGPNVAPGPETVRQLRALGYIE
ncbi:MAG TPA: sulfatase [Candidatus Binatia bacterium]|nr:sulfatase [Candidatus Binatia bacterium]